MVDELLFDENGKLLLSKIKYKIKHTEEIKELLKKTKKKEGDNDIE